MAERTMRLGVALNGYGLMQDSPDASGPEILPWHELLLIAETAEETGYEVIFTPEIRAREAFGSLAGLANATTAIHLGSGVVPIESRDPLRMAMGAATLQDLSDGRFILGLGSRSSLEHTRSYVRALRGLLAGEEVKAGDGEVMGPLDVARPDPVDVPIFLAALGPRITELAGEVADGVLLNWCTPGRVADARRQVVAGAERAGRDPARVQVAVYVRCCLGHDEAHALTALRGTAARYAAMDRYQRQLVAMGLGPQAEAAARAWASGNPDAVAEDLLRAVSVWGSRQEALARLEDYDGAGADLVVVYPVPAQEAASSLMGTVLAAAPDPAMEA